MLYFTLMMVLLGNEIDFFLFAVIQFWLIAGELNLTIKVKFLSSSLKF